MKTILLISAVVYILSVIGQSNTGNEIKVDSGKNDHIPSGKYDLDDYESYDKPNAYFNARNNERSSITLVWKYTGNVPQACNDEVKRRGIKQTHNSRTVACSFWGGNECLIITNVKTTMHSVGHEIRHCFQGAWHD